MKRLFILSAITAGTLFASSAYSQVYVNAHIGFGLPFRKVVLPPPPAVVYQQPAPAPVCQESYPAPAPEYQDGYEQPTTAVYEDEFPGYVYYNYPVWNGHYRDHVYYEHYRPYFERNYRPYFDRGRFDHVRFEREHPTAYRGGADHRGYGHRW